MPQLLSLCSGALEPQLLSHGSAATEDCKPLSPCSTAREATSVRSLAPRLESSPCLLQLYKKPTQKQRPSIAKNKNKKHYKKKNTTISSLYPLFMSEAPSWPASVDLGNLNHLCSLSSLLLTSYLILYCRDHTPGSPGHLPQSFFLYLPRTHGHGAS